MKPLIFDGQKTSRHVVSHEIPYVLTVTVTVFDCKDELLSLGLKNQMLDTNSS